MMFGLGTRWRYLVAAYQALVRQSAPKCDGGGFDYQDMTFHLRVVTLAHLFASYFLGMPHLHDIARKLIHVEIVVAENCPSTQALICSGYLWRAVDQEGEVLESFVTKARDTQAALTFMKKSLKRHGSPEAITTDGLRSYGAAMNELGNREKR